jgi:glycosyltransferase involved in cell wall biosynthesis
LAHLRVAKALGLATVITIHDPGPICQRGTLMFGGQTTCDGNIDHTRCSRCCGVPSMLPVGFVKAISQLPQPLINRIELPPGAQIWTNPIQSPHQGMKAIAGALMRSLVVPNYIAQRQQKLWQMFEAADRIIAVCQWLYDALLINGIPKEKLILSRCGVAETLQASPQPLRSPLAPLKLAYLGRWDPNKGIHILVEAIQQLPAEVPVELTIYGIKQGATYRKQIVQQVANDARFRIEQPLSRADIAKILPQFDALVVPSQWLEAGPLVVLEAHALGVPVIGSNLGGIAELVKHDKNGWLVDPQDVAGWTQAIATLAQNRALLDRLRAGIQSVRTVRQQADDLAEIYQQLAV